MQNQSKPESPYTLGNITNVQFNNIKFPIDRYSFGCCKCNNE